MQRSAVLLCRGRRWRGAWRAVSLRGCSWCGRPAAGAAPGLLHAVAFLAAAERQAAFAQQSTTRLLSVAARVLLKLHSKVPRMPATCRPGDELYKLLDYRQLLQPALLCWVHVPGVAPVRTSTLSFE